MKTCTKYIEINLHIEIWILYKATVFEFVSGFWTVVTIMLFFIDIACAILGKWINNLTRGFIFLFSIPRNIINRYRTDKYYRITLFFGLSLLPIKIPLLMYLNYISCIPGYYIVIAYFAAILCVFYYAISFNKEGVKTRNIIIASTLAVLFSIFVYWILLYLGVNIFIVELFGTISSFGFSIFLHDFLGCYIVEMNIASILNIEPSASGVAEGSRAGGSGEGGGGPERPGPDTAATATTPNKEDAPESSKDDPSESSETALPVAPSEGHAPGSSRGKLPVAPFNLHLLTDSDWPGIPNEYIRHSWLSYRRTNVFLPREDILTYRTKCVAQAKIRISHMHETFCNRYAIRFDKSIVPITPGQHIYASNMFNPNAFPRSIDINIKPFRPLYTLENSPHMDLTTKKDVNASINAHNDSVFHEYFDFYNVPNRVFGDMSREHVINKIESSDLSELEKKVLVDKEVIECKIGCLGNAMFGLKNANYLVWRGDLYTSRKLYNSLPMFYPNMLDNILKSVELNSMEYTFGEKNFFIENEIKKNRENLVILESYMPEYKKGYSSLIELFGKPSKEGATSLAVGLLPNLQVESVPGSSLQPGLHLSRQLAPSSLERPGPSSLERPGPSPLSKSPMEILGKRKRV